MIALGCGDPEEAPPRPAPSPAEARIEDVREALPPAPSSVWPDEVQSLAQAVERFDGVDACLAELRGRTPTAVAEGIGDLGYDAFFDDVCNGMAAVRAGDVEGCDALMVSNARAGCRRRLALVRGDPFACPNDRVASGRDPVCVAWAARDPSLCRAAPIDDRARCAAILAGSAEACRRERGGDRARCEAELRRYASALGDERHASRAPTRDAVLRAELTEEGAAPITIVEDVLARGVRLEPRGCRWAIALEGPFGSAPPPSVGEPAAATLAIELSIPAGAEPPLALPVGALGAVLGVAHPTHGSFSSLGGGEGEVELSAFEPRLGGALEGAFHATLHRGLVEIELVGRFQTFVRDLDPLLAACAGSDPTSR